MGAYTGVTAGGFVIGADWQVNDGLVNTVSAMAPLGAPSAVLDRGRMEPGVWQIMPTYRGDHMSLQGGLFVNNNVRLFYIDHISMLNSL